MFLVDACEYLAYSEDLFSMDCDVGGLTRRSTRRFCESKVELLSHGDRRSVAYVLLTMNHNA